MEKKLHLQVTFHQIIHRKHQFYFLTSVENFLIKKFKFDKRIFFLKKKKKLFRTICRE